VTVSLSGRGADVGITVRDPGPMVAFYGDFLGLPLAKKLDWPAVGAQVWFYAIGDGHLKLLAFTDPPGPSNPPGGNRGATGYRYLALEVDDVAAVLDGLEGAGGRVQRPVAEHGDSRVVFVEDPEGNTIEFVQRLG
jgi:catechol 2,3-dioxygenase-like lactoylglutathione lyase family enzyme